MCRAGDPLCVLCVEGDGIKMHGVPDAPRWLIGVVTSVLTHWGYSAFMIYMYTLHTVHFEPFLPRKRLVSGANGQHNELARREKHMNGPRLASSRGLRRAPQRHGRLSRLVIVAAACVDMSMSCQCVEV